MIAALELHSVWKFFGDYPALQGLSFIVEPGQCCALLGRNGAGKTTLLRILAGLTPYQEGRVVVLGKPPRDPVTRQRTGFLGHGIGVYDDLTASENLRFFARVSRIPASRIPYWLEQVQLERVADIPVRQFSRGMRQRLAIARVFLSEPELLVLDEPFTSLDDRAIAMLSRLLTQRRAAGATIILSTHQLQEAFALATRVALLENGRLRFEGPRTEEMLADTGLLYRLYGSEART